MASLINEVMEIDEDPTPQPDPPVDWRTPYLDCLIREVLPADLMEAQRLARRAKSFVIVDEELYRWSPSKVLLRCIPIERKAAAAGYPQRGMLSPRRASDPGRTRFLLADRGG